VDTLALRSHIENNTRMALVDRDVLDIGRRITHGDELWRGDPTMSLSWSPASGLFEVWGLDAHGQPYLAASHERCDTQLLEKLVAGDWQRTDVFARLAQANAKADAARDAAFEDKANEAVDKLVWAVRRDAGHLYGGLRRNVWAVDGRRDA
jgi:hypothetical protein